MSNLIEVVNKQRDQFQAVLSDPSIEFEREAQFALQILGANDYAAKIAMANQQSLVAAINNIAAIGISLNPAKKLAYLVPRDGKICLDISYMGLMDIAQKSGAIQWGQAVIVRENDVFELQGIDSPPLHKYKPFATEEERGPVVGCYVVVKTDTGDYLTHAMSISKINDIRDRSSAWKAWMKDKKKCPWVTDYEEMSKKTVIKQAAKYWPRRDRLDSAVHYMNTDGGEGIVTAEKDITPCSGDDIVTIEGLLEELGKKWEDLAPLCVQVFKRSVENIADLSPEEAGKVIAFLKTKKEKKHG